jgi:hypothetical protein
MIEVVGTGPTPSEEGTDSSSTSHPPAIQLAVWTAAASAQLAMEDLDLGGKEGLFTNRFVKGIADGAADLNKNGRVTASELLAFLRGESDRYCATHRCGAGGLSPTLEAWAGYDGHSIAEYEVDAKEPESYGATLASTDYLPEHGYPVAGGVSVSLAGGTELHYGDPLRIKVTSEYYGELVVLDIRDDGTTVQLFPNEPSLKVGADTTIEAGETRYLPGDEDPFELVPDEKGSGRIVALVIDSYSPIYEVTGRYLDLEPIESPDAYIAEISRELNRSVAYPTESEDALYEPAKVGRIARGEAKYTIY